MRHAVPVPLKPDEPRAQQRLGPVIAAQPLALCPRPLGQHTDPQNVADDVLPHPRRPARQHLAAERLSDRRDPQIGRCKRLITHDAQLQVRIEGVARVDADVAVPALTLDVETRRVEQQIDRVEDRRTLCLVGVVVAIGIDRKLSVADIPHIRSPLLPERTETVEFRIRKEGQRHRE